MSDALLDRLGILPTAQIRRNGNGKPTGAVYENIKKPEGKGIFVDVDATWKQFPTGCLPGPVAVYVQTAADAIGCDPSFVALPMLSCLAGAVGTSCRIELKADWCEPSVVWSAIVGDSGTHKSPALKAATRFADARDGREVRFHAAATEGYEQDLARYETDLKDWQKKRIGPMPEKPTVPTCKRFLVADVTVEGLADRLADNPRGLVVARDELAGWLDSHNQYKAGKGADTAAWLSVHNAASLRVDRRGGDRKTIFVPSAAVSIAGGIQPGVLARSLGTSHFQDGLAARILLAYPPKLPRRWTNRRIPGDAIEAVGSIFDRLWRLEADVDENGDPRPIDLPLTDDAQAAWIRFYNLHGAELGNLTGDLAAAWSKLEGYAARLALIVHLVDWATGNEWMPGPVGLVAVQSGIELAEWFKNETRRVYTTMTETDEQRASRELVELVRRRGGRITARELQQASRAYPTAEDAEQALGDLVKAGAGEWEGVDHDHGRGRPTRIFRLSTLSTSTEIAKSPEKP